MDESEIKAHCAALGVEPGVTQETLERIYLKQNLALIRQGTPAEREELRAAYEALAEHLRGPTPPLRETDAVAPAVASARVTPQVGAAPEPLNLFSFDSWRVNLLALPLVTAMAWLANISPLGFFLKGFHIWTHEFGHATVAWLTGKRALPLPIGWTSVEADKSNFVYFGVLFLLAVLFVAGWKERKIWPMLLALGLAPLQFYLTWRLPEHRADLWQSFAGVGGEFYLGAAMMALFYVQLPDKFKWGVCRYFFLFLGASSFLNIYLFWRQVRLGNESIPWGSMVQGEEDGGGDMNILRDDYRWSNHDIIGAYTHLGNACVVVLLVVYAVFALRLDRFGARWLDILWPE